MNDGRILHRCCECKTGWFPTRREMTRAAGIKCPGCGSRFFEESKAGREQLRLLGDELRDQDHRLRTAGNRV